MVDDVDGHHQVEGPGGERQAVEVGLHQGGCGRRGGGVGEARLEEFEHLGVTIGARDLKPRGEQGPQVAADAAAGIQNPAAASRLPPGDQAHELRIGPQSLHPGIGKEFSPNGHGDLNIWLLKIFRHKEC